MAHPNKKNDWITPSEFRKMSNEDKDKLIKEFKRLYCEELIPSNQIHKYLGISYKLTVPLKKEYNITRTKEQDLESNRKACMEKHGVTNTTKLKDVREKLSQSWKNKSNEERKAIVNKRIQTNIKKYGNACSLHGVNQEKTEQRFLELYGVTNPYQTKHVRNKIKEKYGNENPFNCVMCQDKVKQTKLERYGDSGYNNMEQIKQTDLERYGVECIYQLDKFRIKSGSMSKINLRFAELLKINNIEFEQEFKIKNRSYDFKVGNILIEINPTYTHNSTSGAWFGNYMSKPLTKTYHLEKSQLAKENGFHVIHIWDWDDWNKIVNMFTLKKRIYARDCKLKDVSKQIVNKFLNNYHLQGKCNGQKICYGLYYDDQLIQIMTFGKPRYNKNYEWELLRLCTHKDYKVVGGSERLWKHFLREQNPTNVISYCDDSKFSGEVYERLGMELIDNKKPSCHWSKGNFQITQNLLNQRGFDQLFKTNYGKVLQIKN